MDKAGFDAAIDCKAQHVGALLSDLGAPTDYFDDLGGDMLRTAMSAPAQGCRVVPCGIVANHTAPEEAPCPSALDIVRARAAVMGLVVYDWEAHRYLMIAKGGALIRSQRFAWREDESQGPASAQFPKLIRGGNHDKTLDDLGDD